MPFLDIESPDTWPRLENDLASELHDLRVTHLDVPTVRSDRRLVTRLIATWDYLATEPDLGFPSYSGIRYVSKLGGHECWAIFDGAAIRGVGLSSISSSDAAYLAAAKDLDLVAH